MAHLTLYRVDYVGTSRPWEVRRVKRWPGIGDFRMAVACVCKTRATAMQQAKRLRTLDARAGAHVGGILEGDDA